MNDPKKSTIDPELSVIIPCKNEEEALPFCLKTIKQIITDNNIAAEIIVSDSSTDSSPKIAEAEDVVLVKHNKDGYGVAYLEAFSSARGKYIFMADADGTYDFGEIINFLEYLRKGYDLVLGDRFSGIMEKGAMPFSHKHFGNPLLSGILRIMFKTAIKDSHCGVRAISKEALTKLNLKTTGMEFASEMVIKAIKSNLKIMELPVNYRKRRGSSKLKPFADSLRHIRYMLRQSPLYFFNQD